MHAISTETLKELDALTQSPCLTLYQPTHRSYPDNLQDRVEFRRGIEALRSSLEESVDPGALEALLEPFHRLATDAEVWVHALDGLAVFASPLGFRAFALPHAMPAQATVSDSFHTAPLRRFLQSVDRYQVLCLSRDRAQLFEGNRDALEELVLAPEACAAGEDRFFRELDAFVLTHHSQPSGLPLILAALPEHQQRFRQISRNSRLLPVGLDVHPGAMNVRALSIMAWHVVEPQHNARQQVWIDAFVVARAQGRASDDVRKTAKAAAQGRVGLLLIEEDRSYTGQFDRASGRVDFSHGHAPGHDVLDDIAETVERQGGAVRVIPASHMPTRTGLAAAMRA